MLKRSFYHYVLTLRGATMPTAESIFASHVGVDSLFPKHTASYDELATYLEMETDYLPNMDIFDEIWQKYLEHN